MSHGYIRNPLLSPKSAYSMLSHRAHRACNRELVGIEIGYLILFLLILWLFTNLRPESVPRLNYHEDRTSGVRGGR